MATLEQVRALNRLLRALAPSGSDRVFDASQTMKSGDLSESILQSLPQSPEETPKHTDDAAHADRSVHDATLQYQRLIRAGTACDDLPAAAQLLVDQSQQIATLRNQLLASLVYPTIVFIIAVVFLISIGAPTASAVAELSRNLLGTDQPVDEFLTRVLATFGSWSWILPLLGLVWLAWRALSATRRDGSLTTRSGSVRLIPGIDGVIHDAQLSGIAKLTSLLVRSGVPIRQALSHAAQAIIGRELTKEPPFLAWAVAQCAEADASRDTTPIDSAAELYEERAMQRSDWLRWIIPYSFLAIVAGGMVLFYAMHFWEPFCRVVHSISELTYSAQP